MHDTGPCVLHARVQVIKHEGGDGSIMFTGGTSYSYVGVSTTARSMTTLVELEDNS